MKLSLIAVVVAAAAPFAERAWGADADPAPNVRVDLQIVSISVKDSLQLVPALREAKTAGETWTRLQEMLAQGKAVLIDWPVLWLRGSNRFGAETTEEARFPTEFEPPQQPQNFSGWPLRPKKWLRPEWEKHVPNVFETRNLGTDLEAQAAVKDNGRIIAVSLSAHRVNLPGFKYWRQQPSPLGVAGQLVVPDFVVSKVTGSFHVRQDRPTLVGVFVLAKPESHVELFILRAQVLSLPPEATTPEFPKLPDDPHSPPRYRMIPPMFPPP